MSEVIRDERPEGSNPTNNPRLEDIIEARLSRRSMLAGTLGVAAAQFFAVASFVKPARGASSGASAMANSPLLGFTEVPVSDQDTVVVPPGYTAQVLIPWGTPLFGNTPAFLEDASNSAADQEQQVGFNHDGLHYFPLFNGPKGSRRGLLALNHEYTDDVQIYSDALGTAITPDAIGSEKVAKALAGHGATVVEVRRLANGTWIHVPNSPYNRRITGSTPMAFSGPVDTNHPMLQSAVSPTARGTLNNCGHGFTPWGTYLAAEENWNGYFGTDDTNWVASALESRYGVTNVGFGYNWHKAESRFDVAVNGAEANHFGWIVEIDPFQPNSTPVKRSQLGRFKHEGATVTVSQGRAVVYSGDDENGEYMYKFVGNGSWQARRALGQSPLDHGTLYVAKFEANGEGNWLPLKHGVGPLTCANGWADQADVLIRTRMAADAVGATRLHRPEWVTVEEHSRDVYVTLTNGSGNSSPVNSDRNPNPYGHIVRIREQNRKNTAKSFDWDIFALGGDPAYDPAVPASQALFGSPDGIWSDPDGRLWIQTDISNSSQNRADRGYDNIKNNMMLAANTNTGEIKRFLTGPRGCEVTGVIMTPDQKTMFVNIQHPGESTTFWNNQFGAPSTANPTTVSSWPFNGRPRSATVVITKNDGGKIGT
jgi:secreted PhoX family phosphatase